MQEQGTISVHSENIFPIIKKFLYADQDVFLRELVSNAVDATQKLKQLATIGEYEGTLPSPLRIKIQINKTLKTLTVSDQGLGMTADEVKKYINQIAFSGATEFIQKYQSKGPQHQLIGFFGLGFYAAFMVADRVEIFTLSYQKGAEAIHWSCDGSMAFELNKAVKKEVGTDIVLHLNPESEVFLEKAKIKEILQKHCKFLPVEIEFDGEVINNPNPLWIRPAQELTDQDYLAFYQELYPLSPDPLFWIHLNVDYPFNLTGILYFPPITQQLTHHPHQIQLYTKQVFITQEVKDIVPPFLMLLHGVIDSPDIPLNVSRSYLQADSNVKKINTYITKKVADKLEELFKDDRKAYEAKWPSIELFVKYGLLTDEKFYEKAKDLLLVQSVDNTRSYWTLPAYFDKVKEQQTNKDQTIIILYSMQPDKQAFSIETCKQRGYDVLLLAGQFDSPLMEMLEQKIDKVRFKSVDAAPVEQLIEKESMHPTSLLTEEEQQQLQEIYQTTIADKAISWNKAAMDPQGLPLVITVPELAKRLESMAPLQSPHHTSSPISVQATINTNHPIAKKLLLLSSTVEKSHLAQRIYQLGLLAQGSLNGKALAEFIQQTAAELIAGQQASTSQATDKA
jgi:molecular chaperone HtpG